MLQLLQSTCVCKSSFTMKRQNWVQPRLKLVQLYVYELCGDHCDLDSAVCYSFFQLRLTFSFRDSEKAIHAFISSRLVYCNALYIDINQASVSHLQLVQNAAACLLTHTCKCDHITPVLSSRHRLPSLL